MSDVWSDPSSTSVLHVCEQRRFWRDGADAQARLSLRLAYLSHDLCTRLMPILSWTVSDYCTAQTEKLKVDFRSVPYNRHETVCELKCLSLNSFSPFKMIILLLRAHVGNRLLRENRKSIQNFYLLKTF